MQCAGEVYPDDCYGRLSVNSKSVIIDVRTKAEVQYVGIIDVSQIEAKMLFIEWQTYPTMQINNNFISEVETAMLRMEYTKEVEIYCLCRVGARSLNAANLLAQNGFENCFNILGGFQGHPNEKGQRGHLDGWVARDLPWRHI